MAAGDYTTACGYLTPGARARDIALARRLIPTDTSCPAALGELFGGLPPALKEQVVQALRAATVSDVQVEAHQGSGVDRTELEGRPVVKAFRALFVHGSWQFDETGIGGAASPAAATSTVAPSPGTAGPMHGPDPMHG